MALSPWWLRRRKPIPMQTAESAHIPAPLGGLNTIDPGYGMPDSDCPLLYNMIGAENGLRSRLGYREWCTNLTGNADNTVRSILPFTGSHKNGSSDRLFACTSTGIWDVSSSSASPTQTVGWLTSGGTSAAGDAGYCISCVSVNSAGGHFLLLCDEENGYYTYTEATSTWTRVIQGASTAWQNTHAYILNDQVSNGGLTYLCTLAGTSGATGPTGTGTGIVDGGAHWDYQPSITGVDPATFCYVMVWKNRVWFVQKDTGIAWYLPIGFGAGGSIYGTATAFNFGAQFKNGGPLVGLYSWTTDGGSGPDDRLVAVSGGGDVVIYAGTDPSLPYTFGLVGRWYLGGVPYGRRIATDHGGDLLVLSNIGIIPLSKLVLGNPVLDRTQYSTYKISNLFNRLAATYRGLKGWSLRIHPEDNSLIVSVPVADGQATNQLAMSLTTRGWSQYRNLPLLSMDAWGGLLYFGTADGKVCINTNYIDGVTLADPNAFTPIDCSVITKFNNLGNGNQKQLTIIRPTILSEGGSILTSIEARYRYNLNEAASPSGASTSGESLWDSAVWDSSTWGGAYSTQQNTGGAAGMGPDAAIACRLSATSRTVLVGFDIEFVQGGML
jgi:hypothetical protein